MFESNELSSYLTPNERVLWQGQGKRRLNAASSGGVLFIAMFVGFALLFVFLFVATSSRSRGGRDDDFVPFIIMPIIFLSVGLGVGIPLLMMGRRSSNARYFVTNQSAVIVYPSAAWSGKRVTIIPLKNVPQITLSENRDGTGTLTFGQSLMAGYGRYSNSWWADSTPALSNIERPQEVYQLIRKQIAEV